MSTSLQDAQERVHHYQAKAMKPVLTQPDHDPTALHEEALFNSLQDPTAKKPLKIHARQEEKEELELKQAALQLKRDNLQFLVDGMKACAEASPDSILDERTKLLFKDRITNLALGNLTDASTNAHIPITISAVALELGISLKNGDCSVIGREAKKRYVKRHGKNPTQHSQNVDGAVRMVNSYDATDRDILVDTIKNYHDSQMNPERFNKRRKLMPSDQ